jgi:hypothetical protein
LKRIYFFFCASKNWQILQGLAIAILNDSYCTISILVSGNMIDAAEQAECFISGFSSFYKDIDIFESFNLLINSIVVRYTFGTCIWVQSPKKTCSFFFFRKALRYLFFFQSRYGSFLSHLNVYNCFLSSFLQFLLLLSSSLIKKKKTLHC